MQQRTNLKDNANKDLARFIQHIIQKYKPSPSRYLKGTHYYTYIFHQNKYSSRVGPRDQGFIWASGVRHEVSVSHEPGNKWAGRSQQAALVCQKNFHCRSPFEIWHGSTLHGSPEVEALRCRMFEDSKNVNGSSIIYLSMSKFYLKIEWRGQNIWTLIKRAPIYIFGIFKHHKRYALKFWWQCQC